MLLEYILSVNGLISTALAGLIGHKLVLVLY